MARVLGGGIRPYNTDGKKGLTIEGIDYVNIDGKLQTNDDRLLTTSKDIVGAINELFNLEPEGGDTIPVWEMPDYIANLPDPASNQAVILIRVTSTLRMNVWQRYTYDGQATIDWGDGNVEVVPDQWSFSDHTYAQSGYYTVIVTLTNTGNKMQGFYDGAVVCKIGSAITKFTEDSTHFFSCETLQYVKFFGAYTLIHHDFSGCYALKQVDFTVQPTTIPSFSFSQCKGLYKADFPEVTSVGENAFSGCKSIYSINMPKLTIAGDNCFSNCVNLRKVNMPLLQSVGVNAFSASAIRKIELPELLEANTNMFQNNRSLEFVLLPKCTMVKQYAFHGCTGLRKIILPSCTLMEGHAFYSCESLETVETPLLITAGDYCFGYDNSLKDFTYAIGCTFGTGAFTDCYNLYPIPV